MALTKEVVEDRIEILDNGMIQIRQKTKILDSSLSTDDKEISSSYHRKLIVPCAWTDGAWVDTDISAESAKVQAYATTSWTDETVAAYKLQVGEV